MTRRLTIVCLLAGLTVLAAAPAHARVHPVRRGVYVPAVIHGRVVVDVEVRRAGRDRGPTRVAVAAPDGPCGPYVWRATGQGRSARVRGVMARRCARIGRQVWWLLDERDGTITTLPVRIR